MPRVRSHATALHGNTRCCLVAVQRAMTRRTAHHREHEMQTTTTEQPNTMDEPGGPEAPMPARNRDANEKGGAGSTRKDKAAHGAPTDADFERPVVPRE